MHSECHYCNDIIAPCLNYYHDLIVMIMIMIINKRLINLAIRQLCDAESN